MKLEPEVRRRYAQWARELAEALEAGREDAAAHLLVRFNGPGAWALREGVEQYLRQAIEALGAFSQRLLDLQTKYVEMGEAKAVNLDALVLLAEGSVHRTLDALERAFGELDQLGEARFGTSEPLQAPIERLRLALQEVLSSQGFQDELGQVLGRCVKLAEALTLQLDALFHRLSNPLPFLAIGGAEQIFRGTQGVTQEQIDRLLQYRGDHG
jgi:hypothetical protein